METIEYRGFTIEIRQDEYPMDPREWDNLGVMACWHRRYKLGDEQPGGDPWEWMERIEDEIAVILPLYLYDHSGLWMSTSDGSWPFNCRWDAGQAGWIYATKEAVRKNFMIKRISKKTLAVAIAVLRGEVETYNQYLSGEVFGYAVRDAAGDILDGCSGFYGYEFEESGLLIEARNAIDWHIKRTTERHTKQLKAWVRHDVPLGYRQPFPLQGVENV